MKLWSIFFRIVMPFATLTSSGAVLYANSPDTVFGDDSTRVYSLDDVEVTAGRVQMSLGTSARIVTVLDSLPIANIPAGTVNDLLKYAVGIDVRQRGNLGMQTDISMRGGTFDQIAILLNGINISDPQTGHNAADFPVSAREIERIEILEGPASRVYGTSSLVGAINIITRRPKGRGLGARFGAGKHMTLEGGAEYHTSRKGFSSIFSADFMRTDGYSRSMKGSLNGDSDSMKAFWRGVMEGSQVQVSAQAGFSNKNFGSNTFYSARFDEQFEHTAKCFAAIQAETKGTLRFSSSLYWNYGFDRFELVRGNDREYPFNYHRTNVSGANLATALTTVAGETSLGIEFRNENIRSTNLGESLDTPTGRYVKGLTRLNYGIHLEHSLIRKRFTVSGGFSIAGNSTSRNPFGFYPGIDASLRVSDSWKIYASANTSFRNPTFTDLYYSAGGHSADRNLNPERMTSLECGLKYMKSGFRAVASIYCHRGRDMIDWIKNLNEGEEALWRSVNHTRLNTVGEEFTVSFDLPVMTAAADFPVRTISIGYSHIDQDKQPEANIQSAYAMEYLRNKVSIQTDLQLGGGFDLSLTCRWMDRAGSYELFENCLSTGRTENYSPYTLIGARFSWKKECFRLFIDGDNLLNKVYYDHGNIPQGGLWLYLGLEMRLPLE